MTNPKGTAFETLMVEYLKQFWPEAERRARNGAKDRGDISGLPLPHELKNCKKLDLAGWQKEAEAEAENAGAIGCPIIHKRKGKGDPALQWVTMPVWLYVEMLISWEERNE